MVCLKACDGINACERIRKKNLKQPKDTDNCLRLLSAHLAIIQYSKRKFFEANSCAPNEMFLFSCTSTSRTIRLLLAMPVVYN